jgi:hypothetical protein
MKMKRMRMRMRLRMRLDKSRWLMKMRLGMVRNGHSYVIPPRRQDGASGGNQESESGVSLCDRGR